MLQSIKKLKLLALLLAITSTVTFATTVDEWDGTTYASSFASGTGTSTNPYVINSGAQLAYFIKSIGNGTTYSGKYIKLGNNIDLNNKLLPTTGDFYGDFNGNNHQLQNCVFTSEGYMFKNVYGVIRNLGLKSKFNKDYSSLTYTVQSNGLIFNCNHVFSGGKGDFCNSSAFAYQNLGQIVYCYAEGEAAGGHYIGSSDSGHSIHQGGLVYTNQSSGIILNCLSDIKSYWDGYKGNWYNIVDDYHFLYQGNWGMTYNDIETDDTQKSYWNTWKSNHSAYNYNQTFDATTVIKTVTFHDPMGFCATTTQQVNKGSAIGTLPVPEYDCTFNGWKIGANFIYPSYVVTEDITIEAAWTQNIKQQPTFENPEFIVDDLTHASYQWYKGIPTVTTFDDWTSTNIANSTTDSKTYSIVAKKGNVLSFNWSVSSETYDRLSVNIGYTSLVYKSGEESGLYEYIIPSDGTYTLKVSYTKDSSGSAGTDNASVTNIKLLDRQSVREAIVNQISNIFTFASYRKGENFFCVATYSNTSAELCSDVIIAPTDGPELTHDIIYTVDGEEYQRATVEDGSTITLIDAPTKDGHTFSGWSGYPEDMIMPNEDVTIVGTFTKNAEPEPTPESDPDTDISDIANTIYFDNTEVLKGREFTLSVKMKNSIEPTGFQFDLYLPEGVTVVQDAEGFCDVALSTERTTTAKTNTFDSAVQRDGALRVLAASTKNYAFSGNDGEVCIIKLRVDESLEPGDYSLILKGIEITNNAGATWSTEYLKRTLTVVDYTLGDVNADTKINVGDFSAIASHIMGDTPAGFVEKAADVNNDTKINVGDLSGLVTMIMNGGEVPSQARMRKTKSIDVTNVSELDNVIYPSEFNVVPGADAELVFNMKNDFGATGFQFDFTLPEGMSIPEVEDGILDATLSTVRTTALKTNTFECGKIGNNTYRVLVASTRNYEYEGNDGEVVRVRIHADENMAEGSYALNLTAITLTDAHGATYDTEKLVAELKVGEEEIIYAQGYTICTTPIATTAGAANTIVLNFAGVDENITDIEFDMEMPACLTRTKSGRVTKAFEGADENRMWVSGTEGDHTITVDGTHVTIAAIVNDEYKYIAGTSGALVNMYYTTATGTADGIYPINFSNITIKNGDGDILKLAPTTSYIKVGNPTGESLALVGHVAEEVNAALATEDALASVDMSKVVSMDGTLTLVDGRDFIAPKKSVTAPTVIYNAVVSPSLGYKTLVLPYDCTVPAGFEAYEVGSVTSGTLDMVAVNTITANKPVILKNAGTATLSANNAVIAPADGALTDGVLVGTYEAISAPVGSYVLQNHGGNVAFYRVTEAAQPVVGAFRAYLSVPSSEARIRVVFDGEATGIEDASDAIESNAVYYNIAGQRVSKFAKGVVINNGHKIVK